MEIHQRKSGFSRRSSLRETASHGKKIFPFAVYHGRIPEWLDGFPLHWHDEFEIIFVSYGTGIVTVQGSRFLCCEGDIVLIPPGAVHSILQNGDDCIAYYNILFSISLLEENPDSFCSRRFFSAKPTFSSFPYHKPDHSLPFQMKESWAKWRFFAAMRAEYRGI